MAVSTGTERLFAGDVARLLGVGVQTLHFYEREGLIPEVPRTPPGYRTYPPTIVDRVRFIRQSHALGLPLAQVKEILSLADCGGSPCGRVQDALEAKLAEVDRRLSELRRFRRDLVSLVERAKTDYSNRPGARVCAIVENAEPTRSLGSGLVALRVRGTGRRRRPG